MTIWANRLYPREGAVRTTPSVATLEEMPVVAGRESARPAATEQNTVVRNENFHTAYNPVVYRENTNTEQNFSENRSVYDIENNSAVYRSESNTEHNTAVYHGDTNTESRSAVYRSESNTEKHQTVYHTEVRVDVVNHNQIKSGEDMEALAERFAETLRERIFSAAEGVYA